MCLKGVNLILANEDDRNLEEGVGPELGLFATKDRVL